MPPRKSKNRDIVAVHSGSNSEHTHTSDEDFQSGVGLSPRSGSQGAYTSSSGGSYVEDDDDGHIPGGWEDVRYEDEFEEDEELTPSDSASRPSGSRKPRPVASQVSRSHRKSTRRAPVQEAPPPPRQSRPRKAQRDPREYRRRTTSVESDSVESHDDYPGYPGYGRAPPHPSAQWGHIPHPTAPPPGYASSSLVSGGYPPAANPFTSGGGMPPPGNQLVPFGQQDYGFSPHGHPFYSPGTGSSSSYFGEIPFERRGMDDMHDPYGRGGDPYRRPPPRDRPSYERHQSRHRYSMPGPPPSMGGPPGHEMMPYGGMYGGYPPPMGPYGYPHHSSGHTPPSKKATPAPNPEPAAAAPPPPVPAVVPTPSPENDRIAKLEALLQAQLKMQEDRAEIKRRNAEEAARLEAEAKKKGDEDKLAKLEKLILAQKAEQLAREKAAEAKAEAAKKEADAKAAKEAADKKAAEEEAARLVEAAKKAREEAEAQAKKEADDAKAEHDKALAEAKKAADEAAEAQKKAEEDKKAAEAALKPPPEDPKAPIKFKDAVGRKFSFPWHICKTWSGMEGLIKQAFLHVDVIGMHVQEGHYDLVGPNNEIILPQVWETMIQPDWNVTMHMWPMPEPPPPEEKLPPGPPPLDPAVLVPPLHKKNSTKKNGKKMAAPPPPPPPPPPPAPGPPPPPGAFAPVEVMPLGPGGQPDMVVMEPGKPVKPKPKPSKPASGLAWFAGGGNAKALKGPKRTDGSSVMAGSGHSGQRAHANDEACVLM